MISMKVPGIIDLICKLHYPANSIVSAQKFRDELVAPIVKDILSRNPLIDLDQWEQGELREQDAGEVTELFNRLEGQYPLRTWAPNVEKAATVSFMGFAGLLALPVLSLLPFAKGYWKTAAATLILGPASFIWTVHLEQQAVYGILVKELKDKVFLTQQ